MKKKEILIASFLISLFVWSLFTWPLPKHVAEGIPMAHAGGKEAPVRFMEAGDHLQLLYYYWLFSDMLAGETEWMYNPYEFHTGDEEARYEPHAYYAPFSWVYAVVAPWGGRALGFNLAGLASIWLAYFFTWLLVRRYVRPEWLAAAMALIGILLPYRWFTLLGGSPTGFAMALTPLLLWGLDRAVRNDSIAGGVWAGVALIFSFTGDLHVFFFNVLLTPAWALFALLARSGFNWRSVAPWRRIAVALLPTALLLAVVLLYTQTVARELTETHMAEGRAIGEVMAFSPQRGGFFGWAEHPVNSQVYIGYTLALLLMIGGAALAVRGFVQRPRPWREAVLYTALLVGVALIALLALGPHGPRGAGLFHRAREWIPPYQMIRQTGKIFAILPSILALLAAMAASHILAFLPRRGALPVLACAVPLLLIGAEYAQRTDPPVCLLADEQLAYAAVADDAAKAGVDPHIFVVTLWPGDAHFASVYQHYCSLYRIRMINGYTPAVSHDYFENIFLRFQSINQGWMTDDQADELMARGIRYLVVHEDLFPEKVSPFPIAFTLKQFLNHPRLETVKQADRVWAFRITDEPTPKPAVAAHWNSFFPARYPELTRGIHRDDNRFIVDDSADRGSAVRLSAAGQYVRIPPTDCPPAPGLRWMIRARGHGALHATLRDENDNILERFAAELDDAAWRWIEWPFILPSFTPISLRMDWAEGTVDLDTGLLAAGEWRDLKPGESVILPAPIFFRAGYIDLEKDQVIFLRDFDEARALFYGPRMPLPVGTYDIDFHFESDAPAGMELGRLHFNTGARELDVFTPVIARQPTRHRHVQETNLPLNIIFVFHAQGDMGVQSITLTRVE